MTDEPPKPRPRSLAAALTAALMTGLYMLASAATGGGVMLIYLTNLPRTVQSPYLLAALIILGFFIAAAIHELGHAATARLVGWRVILIAIRPFAVHFPSRRLVLPDNAFFARRLGFVVAIPPSRDLLTVKRWMLFVAGGALANLAACLVLALAAFALSQSLPPDSLSLPLSLLIAICAALSVQSLYIAVITLLPRTRGASTTDGAKLLEARADLLKLRRQDPRAWLYNAQTYKLRARDVPPWLIDQARATLLKDFPQTAAWADSMEFLQLLDAQSPDPAALRQKLEAFQAAHGATEWFFAFDAYLAALYEADTSRAERALAKLQPPLNHPDLAAAARAALAARHGNKSQTEQHLAELAAQLREKSPLTDPTYTAIGVNIQSLLRTILGATRPTAPPQRAAAEYSKP